MSCYALGPQRGLGCAAIAYREELTRMSDDDEDMARPPETLRASFAQSV